MTDQALQAAPHCHAPIHPPDPVPHPALPLIIIKGAPTVLIGNLPAARVSDITTPCMVPGCVPGSPGIIAKGSPTVLICNLSAARVGDMTRHATCVALIPSPTGTILPSM
jgi:uncharacterized Zn-binding protein involved in type VI secretion